MKKTITAIIILLISLNLNAQSKDSIHGSEIGEGKVTFNDTIPLLSVKDINNYLQQLSQSNVFTPKEFSQFMQVLNEIVAAKQKELQSTNKKK